MIKRVLSLPYNCKDIEIKMVKIEKLLFLLNIDFRKYINYHYCDVWHVYEFYVENRKISNLITKFRNKNRMNYKK